MVAERFDQREDGPVLQEGQLARAEMVEQRPERLGPHRHLGVQAPAAIGIELHSGVRRVVRESRPVHWSRSVDPAHTVDRHLFDQGLLDKRSRVGIGAYL